MRALIYVYVGRNANERKIADLTTRVSCRRRKTKALGKSEDRLLNDGRRRRVRSNREQGAKT